MILKKYSYGNTEFAIDISRIHYIAKDGSKSIVILLKREEQIFITFDSYREREKVYEDILGDIEVLNKPPVRSIEATEQNIQRSEIIKNLIANDPYKTYENNKLRESIMTKPKEDE